jgi:hypothetical protein
MALQKGDRVLVNLAPFIGLMTRSKESIPCEVLGVNNLQVHVCTEPPYRQVSLWVPSHWIDSHVTECQQSLAIVG